MSNLILLSSRARCLCPGPQKVTKWNGHTVPDRPTKLEESQSIAAGAKETLPKMRSPLASGLHIMGQKGHVPHFAARTYHTFAVVVQVGVGKTEQPTTFDISA